jgi:adenosylcobinamide-GDP ribazoletransferase
MLIDKIICTLSHCETHLQVKKFSASIRIDRFIGSLVFYTTLPLGALPFTLHRIASFAPGVGLLIGAMLGLADRGLEIVGMGVLLRSALIVSFWLGLTGGLHLDGAMDTADGLSVTDPQRRLAVMSDSRSGAFGVMAAIVIVLLKTTALASLQHDRGVGLALAAGWGRWSQVVAIARYPYLKLEGKGAFHRQAIQLPQDWMLGLVLLLVVQGWTVGLNLTTLILSVLGIVCGLAVPAYFQHRLGGQTGDTYGAIVEWTETLLLIGLSLLF